MTNIKSKVGLLIWCALEFLALIAAFLAVTSLVVTLSTGLVHIGLVPKTGNPALDGDAVVLVYHLLIFLTGGVVCALAAAPLARRSYAAFVSLLKLLVRWVRAVR